MSWSPKGDRLAYFVRTEKERTLIVQNVLTAQDRRAHPDEDGRRAGVAGLLARRPARSRSPRCAAAIGDIFIARSRRPRQITNLTNDDFADYGADLLARRQVHRLHRARQRQREAVPPRSRHQEEDAAHLRHARRDGGAVHRRPHAGVLVDGDRPDACRSSRKSRKNGNIYNIWTLDLKNGELRQYTDALGGNWSPIVLNDGKTSRDRVRQLLQGRVQHPHARAEGAAAHRRLVRLRRAGADHRLPGAAAAHAGGGEQAQEGQVREDVPRGPAAGERRRDQQRRRLRRHAGHASATCSATSSSTSSPRRSRSTARCRSSYVEPVAPVPVRAAGLLADAVLLRAARRRLLRPVVRAAHRPRPGDRDAHDPRRHAPSASTRSTATAASSCPAASCSSTSSYNDPALQAVLAAVPAAAVYGAAAASATARSCRSAWRSSRRRRSSASSGRSPAARCGWPTTSRRRSAARCRGRPSTATRATTCASAAPGLLAPRVRGFKSIGRLPRLHLLRRQLRAARLRLPAVRRPERRLRERRAALPADRGGADADRRHRRHPRRVLRQHRRRAGSTASRFTVRDATRSQIVHADRRLSADRCDRQRRCRSTGPPIDDRPGSGSWTARASYGLGLETFALGFPIHFDWSWRTLFNQDWEDVVFAAAGGSQEFRSPQFTVWIGYDF